MHELLVLTLMSGLSILPAYMIEDHQASVQGKLRISVGGAAVLVDAGKPVPLVSENRDIAATLGDERISGRQVKLVGIWLRNGSFSVRQFYVVKGDSLYRLVYFCATCNITTFAPGDCACCQQPTVPTEVLPTDPRIYHEEVKGPPPGHQAPSGRSGPSVRTLDQLSFPAGFRAVGV